MATIKFVRKNFSKIDVVKLSCSPRERVTYPTTEFARFFLHKKFCAISRTVALRNAILPILELQKAGTFFKRDYIFHLLVIHFYTAFIVFTKGFGSA